MTRFKTSRISEALVEGTVEQVWEMLTDPEVIARHTPFVRSISVQDDVWVWKLNGIPYPAGQLSPPMRQLMQFTPRTRIDFVPESPYSEAGAAGRYDVEDRGSHTHLRIEVTVSVDLPLPTLVRGTVETAMAATLTLMGDRFDRGFERELATR